MRVIAAGAALFAVAVAAPALSDSTERQEHLLDRPGEAVEIAGPRTRTISFFERDDDGMRLTVLLSGGAFGGEIVRTHVTLADGQSHRIRMQLHASASESFSFTREGDGVSVVFAVERRLAGTRRPDAGSAVAAASREVGNAVAN
jgi:hypothetical protein